MTTRPTITSKDNGYFEIWVLSCGHKVRVYTEDTQWQRRTTRGFRAAQHARDAERLARPGTCPTCRQESDPR